MKLINLLSEDMQLHPRILEAIRSITVDILAEFKNANIPIIPVETITNLKRDQGWHIGDLKLANKMYEVWADLHNRVGLTEKHKEDWAVTSPNTWYDSDKFIKSIQSRIDKSDKFLKYGDIDRVMQLLNQKLVSGQITIAIPDIKDEVKDFHDDDTFSHRQPTVSRITDFARKLGEVLAGKPITDEVINYILHNSNYNINLEAYKFIDILRDSGLVVDDRTWPDTHSFYISKDGVRLPRMVWKYNKGEQGKEPPQLPVSDELTKALIQYRKSILDKALVILRKPQKK